MRHADQALEDEALLLIIQQELSKRCKKSKTRGRPGTTSEIILRMLLLKHFRDWSFEDLTREVRANLVYREFTRIGGGKVPDDKTMSRLARQLGPKAAEKLHQRVVEIAVEKKVAQGRKLRVDTTVVETNIHYPTDSGLLGDGVRVLTRVMKRIGEAAGLAGTRLRDRTRSVKLRVLAIARASRNKTESGKQKLERSYLALLDATSRVVGQARKFSHEIAQGIKRGSQKVLRQAKRQLDEMIPRVQQVIYQTRQRVLHGNTRADGKLVSVFEPQTEVIRKGKANKPNEFGQLVRIQEAENQLITSYEVLENRPADATLLIPSLAQHVQLFGRAPNALAADPGFFSAAKEAEAEKMGVKRVSIPSNGTPGKQRRAQQKMRWFRKLQKWWTGCEGRISVLKRRHGLRRSRYKGSSGMKRWVGLGVIADNLIHIAAHMAANKTA
jgi:IS5 family transposase